jgi:hypothetical protein
MIEKTSINDKVNEAIQTMGLPPNTKAIGFAVHLPDSNEFLAMSEENDFVENRMWSKIPDLAKIFKQQEAIIEAKKCGKGACVTLLLNTGPQYVNLLSLSPDELKHYDHKGRAKKPRRT